MSQPRQAKTKNVKSINLIFDAGDEMSDLWIDFLQIGFVFEQGLIVRAVCLSRD